MNFIEVTRDILNTSLEYMKIFIFVFHVLQSLKTPLLRRDKLSTTIRNLT